MKAAEYRMTADNVLGKSTMIWIFLLMHLLANVFLIPESDSLVFGLLAANVPFVFFSIPGLILHLNYYRKSKHRTLILTAETIAMNHRGKVVELVNSEITGIMWYKTNDSNRSPWPGYQYVVLSDGKKQLLIPHYLTDLGHIRRNPLSAKIPWEKMKTQSSAFQYID